MKLQNVTGQDFEQILINIVRSLPPSRAEQLVDFARFLEAQILAEELIQGNDLTEVEAENARWDALLENLASEALEEYRAGKTKPMAFSDDRRIVPG